VAIEGPGFGLGGRGPGGAPAVHAAHANMATNLTGLAIALFGLRFLAMGLTLGIVTDLHFGPEARWRGKLRKMSHRAGEFTLGFAERMRNEVHPDLVVNLGDDVEDESRAADLARYEECQSLLAKVGVPVVNVAGNHDTVNLGPEDLLAVWGKTGHGKTWATGPAGTLYYSFDRGGFHFTVLHTVEEPGGDIHVREPELAWLKGDLEQTKLSTIVLMHHSASEQDFEDSYWFKGRANRALVQERRELRAVFEASKKVRAVFNGHVHRNHFDVIGGIPYVTIQSLIENVDEDAPGRASRAHAVVRLDAERIVVRVHGEDPARYQIESPSGDFAASL
jgi:3',5'-cyclic AMP phosphodiesterase CpdA